jgi:hypothetical protein
VQAEPVDFKLILVQHLVVLTKIYPENHRFLVQLHLPAEALAQQFKQDPQIRIMERPEVAEAEVPMEVLVSVEKEMYLQYHRLKDMMVLLDLISLVVTQEVAEAELVKLELMHL